MTGETCQDSCQRRADVVFIDGGRGFAFPGLFVLLRRFVVKKTKPAIL